MSWILLGFDGLDNIFKLLAGRAGANEVLDISERQLVVFLLCLPNTAGAPSLLNVRSCLLLDSRISLVGEVSFIACLRVLRLDGHKSTQY